MPAPLHPATAFTSPARIAVIGAGIVGVCTAYELSQDGHDVVVYDRSDSVACGSSFGNAGLLSAGSVSPAAGPGLRPWLLRGLFTHENALHWTLPAAATQWRWLRRWWQACGRGHAGDLRAMVQLAQASAARMATLTQHHPMPFERSHGVLMLLRHESEFRSGRRLVSTLHELGLAAEELSADACRQREPGLGTDAELAGGVHLREDGVGNCRVFAQHLREATLAAGRVRWRFNTEVTGGRADPAGVTLQCRSSRPPRSAPATGSPDEPPTQHDAVVLCTGAGGAALLRALGCPLPVAPVVGHSITLPLQLDGAYPQSAVVDARTGVAITRMGNRLRVSGGFSLAPVPAADLPAALRPLYAALDRWFPDAGLRREAQVWSGTHPMLPGGPPVVSAMPATHNRIWLNLGHGAHGWTLASGSARLLADLLGGRAGTVDPAPFSASRWMRPRQ